MLNLGHSHSTYTYENDKRQAWWILGLEAVAAVVIIVLILAAVFSHQACSAGHSGGESPPTYRGH